MKYPNIEAERARAGLTQDQLADKLNVARKTLYNWLTTGIPDYGVQRMAELFDVPAEYLLQSKEDPE